MDQAGTLGSMNGSQVGGPARYERTLMAASAYHCVADQLAGDCRTSTDGGQSAIVSHRLAECFSAPLSA
jgi:hypothetical protein